MVEFKKKRPWHFLMMVLADDQNSDLREEKKVNLVKM